MTLSEIDVFIEQVEELELDQKAKLATKEDLSHEIEVKQKLSEAISHQLDIDTNAVSILNSLSNDVVHNLYSSLEDQINIALSRIFPDKVRKIHIREYIKSTGHPQLELDVITDNGIIRSLNDDSGHGIQQIISMLSLLCIIAVSGERRLLVLDEMLSGLSSDSLRVVDDILWSFSEIGFQFLIVEHGYIPRGAKVYQLRDVGGISNIEKVYTEDRGVYSGNLASDKYQKETLGEYLEE